jgi:phosphatidylserine/phosphatidylglycerophosphate/cardiolipin synthase-like enzyme
MDGGFLLVTFLSLLTTGASTSDPSYDHQTTTYHSKFKPVSCSGDTSITPFFSPDHSIDTYVKLIEEAEETLDVFTPGFDSWSECTPFKGCQGCGLEDMRNEAFPVFPALLNAVHKKGIKVRLLTNDYNAKTCDGKIAPLDWLSLNGIQIRFYTTTTFMHTKYMMVDKGKKTSVSSVNFSHTSFMKNREAGVVLTDASSSAVNFYTSVFENDWDQGVDYKVQQTYNSSAMAYITSTASLPVNVPSPPQIPGAYVTPLTTFSAPVREVYTAPDDALSTVSNTLSSVKSALYLMIYQVTDDQLCDNILSLFKKGIDVQLLVSDRIYDYEDWKLAQVCYSKLYHGGMNGLIQKTPSYYEFSHQKFWIVDNATVHLSSGNWSPSDFPDAATFPPYGSSGWQHANRDFLVIMEGSTVVKEFYKVFYEDWQRGKEWVPN